MILALLVGLLFGFLGSMPIAGPTAVVVLSKGLDARFRAGLYIAIGAAAAESMYAFMAFWGITAVLGRFPILLPASRVIGALILLGLGVYFVVRKSKEQEPGPSAKTTPKDGPRNLLFGFSLTAVNPTLIVTWTAAVSAAHSMGVLRVRAIDAFPFALGAGTGIVGWFALFLWLLSHFRNRVSAATIDRVIRWMGAALIALGVGLAVRAITQWPGHGASPEHVPSAKSGAS